jgi:hypothetical protein
LVGRFFDKSAVSFCAARVCMWPRDLRPPRTALKYNFGGVIYCFIILINLLVFVPPFARGGGGRITIIHQPRLLALALNNFVNRKIFRALSLANAHTARETWILNAAFIAPRRQIDAARM